MTNDKKEYTNYTECRGKLYEVSASNDGVPLLDIDTKDIDVYHFDHVKDWFCSTYRNNNSKLRSCDAYYQDGRDYLVVEFKRTHHFKMKSYMSELSEKLVDSHMILAETFLNKKAVEKIAEILKVVIVYHDSLNYEKGITSFAHNLNTVSPKRGKQTRNNSSKNDIFENEEEFQVAVYEIQEKYQGKFYLDVMFMDKSDFYEFYIKSKYFQQLT